MSKNYLTVLRSRLVFIIIVTLLAGCVGFAVSTWTPRSFRSTQTLMVSRAHYQQTADFQYDSYYAIQAAEALSNNVVSLLETPELARELWRTAGVATDESPAKLVKQIKAKQMASHLVRVNVNDRSEDVVKKVSSAVPELLKAKVEALEQTSSSESAFTVTSSEPFVSSVSYPLVPTTLAALLAGLLAAIALVFLFEYLRGGE